MRHDRLRWVGVQHEVASLHGVGEVGTGGAWEAGTGGAEVESDHEGEENGCRAGCRLAIQSLRQTNALWENGSGTCGCVEGYRLSGGILVENRGENDEGNRHSAKGDEGSGREMGTDRLVDGVGDRDDHDHHHDGAALLVIAIVRRGACAHASSPS